VLRWLRPAHHRAALIALGDACAQFTACRPFAAPGADYVYIDRRSGRDPDRRLVWAVAEALFRRACSAYCRRVASSILFVQRVKRGVDARREAAARRNAAAALVLTVRARPGAAKRPQRFP
jgi:hypothetical protein